MMNRALGAILAISFIASCASPPTQEMSDARQAVKAARQAGAEKFARKSLQSAQNELEQAEEQLQSKKYRKAKKHAVMSKDKAVIARKVASTFQSAAAAMEKAGKLPNSWRDTKKIFGKAKKAARAGDSAKAMKLAHAARQQAENAINQFYLENAIFIIREVEARGSLTSAQKSGLETAKEAFHQKQGEKAYKIARKLY